MGCYRFDLHRKFIHYLHGILPSAEQNKINVHLAKCVDCRGRVERLRSVETILSDLPVQKPAKESWPQLELRVGRVLPKSADPLWKRAAILAAFGLLSGLIGAATYGKISSSEIFREASFNTHEFKPVPITRLADTTEPHIVTEGYVTEAKVEEDDGDRVFKLVANPNSNGPFVICEIIEPLEFPVPPVGSRVRVYGVSRYDGQSDHNWHEVHPVLNIEVLKK